MIIIWFRDKIAKSKSPLTDFYLMLSLIELLLYFFRSVSNFSSYKNKTRWAFKRENILTLKNLFPNDLGMGLYLHLSFEEHAQY